MRSIIAEISCQENNDLASVLKKDLKADMSGEKETNYKATAIIQKR